MLTQNLLNDTHNQLLVYWAGKDVIICLARDVKENSTSTLYISENYGQTFVNVSQKLSIDEGKKLPLLDRFFNHPNHNGRVSGTHKKLTK